MQAMADFLGAASPEEIIIGANMTTLTYHMSRTLGRGFKPGDEIIVTRMDHEGNVSPWLQLAEDLGLVLRFLPFDEKSWQVEEAALSALLDRQDAAGCAELCLEPHRLDQPGQGADGNRQTGRRAGLCRCRAVRAAWAGRRAGPRLRFPGLLGLQILRPAYGHLVGPARNHRCAETLQMPLLVQRPAGAFRTRHAADRTDGRADRRGRLFCRSGRRRRRGRFAQAQDRQGIRSLDRLRKPAGAKADRRPVGH